jgi:hypothetical protein
MQSNADWTVDAVATLMEDNKERTALEISVELGRCRKTVQRALNALSAPDAMQQVHVCGKRGQTLVYVNGQGENVATGGRRKKAETDRERGDATSAWWPRVDQCVASAFRAMCSVPRGYEPMRMQPMPDGLAF